MSLQEAKRRTQHQHSESLPSFPSSIDFGGVLGAIESTLQPEDLWPPSTRSLDPDSGEARKPAVVGAHGLDDVDVDVCSVGVDWESLEESLGRGSHSSR